MQQDLFYLIALQTIIPLLPPPQTNFTATSGDNVVLLCPIQPGALLQQYSVRWMKNNTPIADYNPSSVWSVNDSRYNIDRAKYSLIIIFVTVNDTSTDYKCELGVMNPKTNSKHVLHPLVILSLQVIGK